MAGVGAGTGALGSVIGKLTTLLGDEFNMLKRVRKDIEFLQRELRGMQILVNALADMEGLDGPSKEWKDSMRDLSYDMEECIDRFMLRLGNGEVKPKFVKKTMRRFKTLFERHGIGSQIKELKDRVEEESQRRQRLNLDNYAAIDRTKPVAVDPRLAAFHEVAKGLVGMDRRMDQVVSLLKEKSVELKVVYIVGGGGLGKTTLAMEAYRKLAMETYLKFWGQFQYRASVSVSRTPDLDKPLKDILSQLDKAAYSECQLQRWEKDQIIRQIRQILTGKRYLLVIDDVWEVETWKSIKAAFPDNNNGSRIIVTTRNDNVAKSSCSNSGDQRYQMLPLNDVDSRRLFYMRIFHPDNFCPPTLEDISAKILRKCGGVPLAIITIASLLANKPQNQNEWKKLEDSIGAGLSYESDRDGRNMRHILLLSYWDLPHHLKTCLLYLCIYPEDAKISCEELKWKWVAEGFIATQQGNIYQAAENCFNELVNRSLIQLVDVYDEGFEQYCQVHDMVLDLIISLSVEENFATVLNGVCNPPASKIRRLSLQSNGLEQTGAIHAITGSKLHVHSLNVFGGIKEIPPLVDFQSLRVFDICGYYSSWRDKHIKNIGSFYQLRYLRIHKEMITELPKDIGKLQNLETLDLRCTEITELSPMKAGLQKLKRLFVNNDFVFSADMLGNMRALEEVSDICKVDNPEKFVEELGHLTKLRKISMSRLWLYSEDQCVFISYRERLESSLNKLCKNNLRYIHTNEVLAEYFFRDPCCTFSQLQDLKLNVSRMERVPKGMAFLTNILKLHIEVNLFDEEGLSILMGMPALTYLRLEVIQSARVMTVSRNGFKKLEMFHYDNYICEATTGIKFAADTMPKLRRLHLFWKASYLPSDSDGVDIGIEHLSSLVHLQVVTNCGNATLGKVEAMEGSVRKGVALHPNGHSLQLLLRREDEDKMW